MGSVGVVFEGHPILGLLHVGARLQMQHSEGVQLCKWGCAGGVVGVGLRVVHFVGGQGPCSLMALSLCLVLPLLLALQAPHMTTPTTSNGTPTMLSRRRWAL